MRFVQARHYTPAHRDSVRVVVVHTAECQERMGSAASVAAYFAGEHAPQASAHYTVDRDEVVQSVREEDIAWHANQANGYSIGIEHAGTAAQSPEQWADEYSIAMLERSAELVAGICHRWGIPVVRLSPEQLLAGGSGLCGHVDVNAAYARGIGHWDPGPHFPWEWFLERVEAHRARLVAERSTDRAGGGMLALEGIVDAARDGEPRG